jgi:hypothetical protein
MPIMRIDVEVDGLDDLGPLAIEWSWEVPEWCRGMEAVGFPPPVATIENEKVTLRVRVTQLQPASASRLAALEALVADAVLVNELVGHWSECPNPPGADCDCKKYFAARTRLERAVRSHNESKEGPS